MHTVAYVPAVRKGEPVEIVIDGHAVGHLHNRPGEYRLNLTYVDDEATPSFATDAATRTWVAAHAHDLWDNWPSLWTESPPRYLAES